MTDEQIDIQLIREDTRCRWIPLPTTPPEWARRSQFLIAFKDPRFAKLQIGVSQYCDPWNYEALSTFHSVKYIAPLPSGPEEDHE